MDCSIAQGNIFPSLTIINSIMQPPVTSYSFNAGAAVFPIPADGYYTVHHIHFIPKPLSSLTSYYWVLLHQQQQQQQRRKGLRPTDTLPRQET